jgi:hypothetical protein|tara:strand:+ start:395 stop:724 length:330 start_codon:yes stop_codon:yes gene_type:complete
MKEGEDYIVAQDPESTDESEWVLIINSGEYKDFIIKYLNLQIVDEGKSISYDLDVIVIPEELRDIEVTEEMQSAFGDHCSNLIDHIVTDFHERGVNVYIDKVTGEKVEY